MATTTPDLQDALVKAGIGEDAAWKITRQLEHCGSPFSMSISTGATLARFGLLAIGISWVKSDVGEVRTEIHVNRGHVEANCDRIDTVNAGEVVTYDAMLRQIWHRCEGADPSLIVHVRERSAPQARRPCRNAGPDHQ